LGKRPLGRPTRRRKGEIKMLSGRQVVKMGSEVDGTGSWSFLVAALSIPIFVAFVFCYHRVCIQGPVVF
jgi:hypothetical protein